MTKKKEVPAVLSGMGVGMSILTALMDKVKKRGLPEEVIHRLATPAGDKILDKFVDILADESGIIEGVFRVQVNYGLKLEEAIKAGNYDYEDSFINVSNFPYRRFGLVEWDIHLVHFNWRAIPSDDVPRELDKMGLRPVTLPELLAFGAKYPNEQRERPTVALGSEWYDSHELKTYVPCIMSDHGKRTLNLCQLKCHCCASWRFAAIDKLA